MDYLEDSDDGFDHNVTAKKLMQWFAERKRLKRNIKEEDGEELMQKRLKMSPTMHHQGASQIKAGKSQAKGRLITEEISTGVDPCNPIDLTEDISSESEDLSEDVDTDSMKLIEHGVKIKMEGEAVRPQRHSNTANDDKDSESEECDECSEADETDETDETDDTNQSDDGYDGDESDKLYVHGDTDREHNEDCDDHAAADQALVEEVDTTKPGVDAVGYDGPEVDKSNERATSSEHGESEGLADGEQEKEGKNGEQFGNGHNGDEKVAKVGALEEKPGIGPSTVSNHVNSRGIEGEAGGSREPASIDLLFDAIAAIEEEGSDGEDEEPIALDDDYVEDEVVDGDEEPIALDDDVEDEVVEDDEE